MSAFDAIVVGAGPAGSAAALTLARAGRTVCLIERGPFPVHGSATTVDARVSRARRRQWSASLCRATPIIHATDNAGVSCASSTRTAARNVSDVRSSAVGTSRQRYRG